MIRQIKSKRTLLKTIIRVMLASAALTVLLSVVFYFLPLNNEIEKQHNWFEDIKHSIDL